MCEHERGAEHGLMPSFSCCSIRLMSFSFFVFPSLFPHVSLCLTCLCLSHSHPRTHAPGMYVYCAEILPTTHRQAGLSIGIGSSKAASGLAGVLLFPLRTFSTTSAGHKAGKKFQRLARHRDSCFVSKLFVLFENDGPDERA